MVGIRDWEARAAGKPQKCDLLEVYSDNDKKKLISDHKGNWSLLSSLDEDKTPDMEIGDIIFDDTEDNLEMEQEIKQQAEVQKTGREAVLEQLGDFIDIDDI